MSSSIELYTPYSRAGSRLYCACHWRHPSQHDRGQKRRLRKLSGLMAGTEDTFRSGLFCGSDRVAVLADTFVASGLSTYSVPSKALFKLAGSVKSPLEPVPTLFKIRGLLWNTDAHPIWAPVTA